MESSVKYIDPVRKYICNQCGRIYMRRRSLVIHLENHVFGKRYSCDFCGKFLLSKQSLTNHIRSHLNLLPFECDQCHRRFSSKQNLAQHRVKHSKTIPCTWKGRGSVFESKVLLKKHRDTLQHRFRCSESGCSQFLKNKSYLNEHKRRHAGIRLYICSIDTCRKSFTNRRDLNVHSSRHTSEKNYPCTVGSCSKRFVLKKDCQTHIKYVHLGERKYECGVGMCQKRFHKKSELYKHILVHNNERTYTCSNCPKRFNQLCGLKQHLESHLLPKRSILDRKEILTKSEEKARSAYDAYKCKVCGKVLSHRKSFKLHMLVHSEERRFICKICGKGFKQYQGLYKHRRIIHGKDLKQLECDLCRKKYRNKIALNSHIKTHLNPPITIAAAKHEIDETADVCSKSMFDGGLNKYGCKVCGKMLSQKMTLKLHMQIHSEERRFICKICNKRFKQLQGLYQHRRIIHEKGLELFECDLCGRKYRNKNTLYSHIKTHLNPPITKAVAKHEIDETDVVSSKSKCDEGIKKHRCKCKVCGKVLSQKNTLKQHMQVHSAEKRYACQICDKSFKQSQGLYQHRKIHEKHLVAWQLQQIDT